MLLRDSFPIGSGDGVLCQVQDRSIGNPAAQNSFDRAWAVVCRDSAQPVVNLFAFRGNVDDPASLVAPFRRDEVDCSSQSGGTDAGLPDAKITVCKLRGTSLDWTTIVTRSGDITYVSEGFAAYDSAAVLALRSVMENRIIEGTIEAATTSVSDPVAFSRVQAETLQPAQALTEGYRRNLGGDYAEAAAYFETLQGRLERDGDDRIDPVEFLVNRALQKSNLGEFAEADRLFAMARGRTSGDPIDERLQRNFEAIHLLNRARPDEAIARLDQPLAANFRGVTNEEGRLSITIPIAARLNADRRSGVAGISSDATLTPQERATIIDAQALQLRGTSLRLLGQDEAASEALLRSYADAVQVRDGRVTTIARMRAQILGELGAIAERAGRIGDADTYFRSGVEVLEAQYPERRAVSSAQARLAAFLLRNNRGDEGRALYRGLVTRAIAAGSAVTGFANQLQPYFADLIARQGSDPRAPQDFFEAAQLLVRPGVADTQAVLARELSGGSDEAARLFRQSTDLTREIERLRVRRRALTRAAEADPARIEAIAVQIAELESAQSRTLAQLADFPKYRAVAQGAVTLADFQSLLLPGEAYARSVVVGDKVLMFYADAKDARAWDTGLVQQDLDVSVDVIRASISQQEGGQIVTYPFDMEMARSLYTGLFAPVDGEMAGVSHLIFEPDGALLRLPLDLLVRDDASVSRYDARLLQADADAYDFTGTAWLGRDRMISTATSAQAFIDARRARASNAVREYLGLGRNEPVGDSKPATPRIVAATGNDTCGWSAAEWNNPIDEDELVVAREVVGEGRSQILTGADFTDTAIKQREDLDEFRILHFATHGLVTPPRPECPTKPALLTSFGADQSDGLLTFEEVFDLNLDADVVILSACDTAGSASVEATRAAGLTSGGGTALDGLVRSFIGAGGRAVLASHWPAPDDFRATERLMSEMFRRGQNAPIGMALKQSQALLMDDAETSHPFYWSGFALIGDSQRPLLADRGSPGVSDNKGEAD